jgi:hypothetical protein
MDVMDIFLASTEEDYEACRTLAKEEEVHDLTKLEYPTLLARDPEGNLIGFLGSYYHNEMLFAGPLVVKKRHPRTAMALCEEYDRVCRTIGITGYLMYTEEGTFMHKGITKYNLPGFDQYAKEGNRIFYVRRL